MAQLIKWGSPGADFGNAFAAQIQQNAAVEAKMSQDADANRRENKKVEMAAEASAREGALFQANLNVAESSFSGWDPKRDTSMFTPDLMAKWTSIDNMVSDWKGLSGPEKNAMSLAIGVGIKDFETNLSSHQTMVSVQKHYAYAEAVAARFGTEVPEHIVEAYQQLIGGGGTGGSSSKGGTGAQQNPAELSRMIRAWASQQQVLEANAAEQDSIMRESIDMLAFITTQMTKDTHGGGARGPAWENVKESWMAVLDAINDGETNPEDIRSLVSTARGLTGIMQGPGADAYAHERQAFKEREKTHQANMDDLSVFSQLVGVSPFTNHAKSLVGASRWGKGKLFGSNYSSPELQESKTTTDRILKQAGERHPGLDYIELIQKAHEEIVTINGLYPDLVKDARKTKNWMAAFRAYDAGYMAAQSINFVGPPGLTKMLDDGAMSPGMGQVQPDDTASWQTGGSSTFYQPIYGAVQGRTPYTKRHLRLGPALEELLAEHNEFKDKNNVGRGILGLERLLENRGIAREDFIGKSFRKIMYEEPELADAIWKWIENPPVRRPKNANDGMPEIRHQRALQKATSSDLEASGGMTPVMPDDGMGGTPSGPGPMSMLGMPDPSMEGMASPGGMPPDPSMGGTPWVPGSMGPDRNIPSGMPPDPSQVNTLSEDAERFAGHGDIYRTPAKKKKPKPKRVTTAAKNIAERTLDERTMFKTAGTLDPKVPIAVVENDDGTVSTIRSITITGQVPGRPHGTASIVIPTVHPDGHIMSDDEAVAYFEETGGYYAHFTSGKKANRYAKAMSKYQAYLSEKGSK